MPSLPKAKPSFFARNMAKDNSRWSKGDDASFYDSPRWRALRRLVLAADPFCRYCKAENLATESNIADHIIPVSLGGDKWDRNNLQGICTRHHNIKSSYEGKCTSLTDLKTKLAADKGVGVKNFWHL